MTQRRSEVRASDPSTRWVRARVARPAGDLQRSTAFYRDLLGLSVAGGFRGHAGYDGVFFDLPGGGELELTAGPAAVGRATEEDLLVLYVGSVDELESAAGRLNTAGVVSVQSPNPYWNRVGRTFLDPDGYRVVLAMVDSAEDVPLQIEWHSGSRRELRDLFALAEDSESQLDQYLDLGRVLVARRGTTVLGHLQLVPTELADEIELKNMAVVPSAQGAGIGRALVADAVSRCRDEGIVRIVVATAAADVGNLRFYQRVGFRFARIEPDAFTPATGYHDPIDIDGIPLRDRVWLVRSVDSRGGNA